MKSVSDPTQISNNTRRNKATVPRTHVAPSYQVRISPDQGTMSYLDAAVQKKGDRVTIGAGPVNIEVCQLDGSWDAIKKEARRPTTSDTDHRWLDIQYWIMGAISVGKTTLCNSAESHHAVFDEFLPQPLFDDYIRELQEKNRTGAFPARGPIMAETLQIAMLQGAFIRAENAERTMKSSLARHGQGPCACVVERPAQENPIFERANFRQGNITPEGHERYNRIFAHMMKAFSDRQHELRPKHTTLAPFLWTPEHSAISNMIARNRLSEDGYSDPYLNELAHCYFLWAVDVLARNGSVSVKDLTHPSVGVIGDKGSRLVDLINFNPATMPLSSPIVVDWTNFGTWKDLQDALSAERIQWTSAPATISIRVYETSDYQLLNIFYVKGATASGLRNADVCVYEGETLHADLSWYVRNPDKQTLRSAFRDMFFRARSKMQSVIFHVTKTDYLAFAASLDFYKVD